jgi:hypothetical protein
VAFQRRKVVRDRKKVLRIAAKSFGSIDINFADGWECGLQQASIGVLIGSPTSETGKEANATNSTRHFNAAQSKAPTDTPGNSPTQA